MSAADVFYPASSNDYILLLIQSVNSTPNYSVRIRYFFIFYNVFDMVIVLLAISYSVYLKPFSRENRIAVSHYAYNDAFCVIFWTFIPDDIVLWIIPFYHRLMTSIVMFHY